MRLMGLIGLIGLKSHVRSEEPTQTPTQVGRVYGMRGSLFERPTQGLNKSPLLRLATRWRPQYRK
jgi:hypothetical protein